MKALECAGWLKRPPSPQLEFYFIRPLDQKDSDFAATQPTRHGTLGANFDWPGCEMKQAFFTRTSTYICWLLLAWQQSCRKFVITPWHVGSCPKSNSLVLIYLSPSNLENQHRPCMCWQYPIKICLSFWESMSVTMSTCATETGTVTTYALMCQTV